MGGKQTSQTTSSSSNNANDETTKKEEPKTVVVTKNPVCRFESTLGEFEIELFLDEFPITCSNFIDLVEKKFYDGLSFHRVIAKFMCQFGCCFSKDPNSSRAGTGNAEPNTTFKIIGSKNKTVTRGKEGRFDDEFTVKLDNVPFTVSMANAGPNTNSSQIFINTAVNAHLNGKHVVFGKIISGQDVITKIENCPKGERDKPKPPVFCLRATMGRWRWRKWSFALRFGEPGKQLLKETKMSVCFQNSWMIFQNVALFL